jgi:hypothetical protein
MDETFWRIEDNVLMTWKMKSDESISLIQHRSKDGFTLALTVSASGNILKPLIIGKGKTTRCLRKFQLPDWIHGCYSKSGWMNESIMKNVIDDIFNETKGHESVLVVDKYKSHKKEEVIAYAKTKHITMLFVPSNLTYLRQPLDVSIYGVLKSKSRSLWKKQRLNDTTLQPSVSNAVTRFTLAISFITKSMIQQSFSQACNLQIL